MFEKPSEQSDLPKAKSIERGIRISRFLRRLVSMLCDGLWFIGCTARDYPITTLLCSVFTVGAVVSTCCFQPTLESAFESWEEQRVWMARCNAKSLPARRDLQRVFMHRPGEYTAFERAEDGSFLQISIDCSKLIIRDDAPADASAWLEYEPVEERPCQCERGILHLHAIHDIEGAGWEIRRRETRDKNVRENVERGATTPLE